MIRSLPFAIALLAPSLAAAKPRVVMERAEDGFRFGRIPAPALNDAASEAHLAMVDGRGDGNSGGLDVLTDGRLPANEDQPRANFFLAQGSEGGRLRMDLGKTADVLSIASYSWHRGGRAPQVYTLWGAAGSEPGFDDSPARGTDPRRAGWTPIAKVDTRKVKQDGRQHAALVSDPAGRSLGTYRHLLFDIGKTDESDPFGHTFFSEIDVVTADRPEPDRCKPVVGTFATKDGKYRFVVDATKAPELLEWVEKELMPDVEEWYPKMVAMMPSKGYGAPDTVRMEFKDDMGGTPAYAMGNSLSLSIPFFRGQLQGEAKGCVIHELVHVIQSYGFARRVNRNPSPTPGWVTEGLADYVRWFLYEPEKQGARITRHNIGSARYDGSYRITANFFDWVVRKHHKDLLKDLNAAAREGRYDEKLWETWTGKTLQELGGEWIEANRKALGS
ncbi:MAG: hypothetical protein KDN05_12770 [Verrucomicrobiae bacterium]|nr:hypothetical protein [Verrucomicrobiae bacterium]